ncbi:hypothetical protein GCM10027445_01400 [Amycolatopsis endophytica]|uniref:Uncharacterized protein n=1 Tax=Amycolatopsis endophytica TaxID=860233 RepID=A0A853BA09_9PSEU|nr:hypothetical protein [Amycolatopsis endophytica]NYI91521.1 hypothetical protein [Amycolatopsis endophytica]
MITTRRELAQEVLAALRTVPGLRPAAPVLRPAARLSFDLDLLAIDVDDDVVEIRLVALTLPLPPLLRRAVAALRPVLEGTRWADARLRLLVTGLDAAAFPAGAE